MGYVFYTGPCPVTLIHVCLGADILIYRSHMPLCVEGCWSGRCLGAQGFVREAPELPCDMTPLSLVPQGRELGL